MEWAHPGWLALAPVVAGLAWWEARRSGGVAHPRAGGLRREGAGVAAVLAHAPQALRLLALLALLVALARPRTAGGVVEEEREGVPVVIALDVSSSMLAQDFRPRDRLEVAKRTIAEFVRARENDPVGLVAFAAEALTVVPITTYDPLLLSALGTLRVGLLEDGTAIGEGLAAAVNRLRRVQAESRVVVLMSDGESNRGEVDPLEAARAAAAFGVRVYTIGVGSEGVARVPVEQQGGELRYAELPVSLDEGLLREIATATGGQYFRATTPEALREIYADIDRLVAAPVEARRFTIYTEWYLPLLLLAAAALLAEWAVRASRWGALP